MASEIHSYGARTPPSPRGVRAAVGRVLRAGVGLSAVTLLCGYLVTAVFQTSTFGSPAVERAHLGARALFAHSPRAIWDGIGRGSGEAVLATGVLLLIMTPLAGLIASAVAFARRRDYLFAGISTAVLSIVLGSFLIGWLLA